MADEDPQDPVQQAADDTWDLYDVADWEVRTLLDSAAVRVYRGLVRGGRRGVIVLAILVVLAPMGVVAAVVRAEPSVALYIALSIVPALILAGYVRHQDIGTREPLGLLGKTVGLGILFAGFAAVVNSTLVGPFSRFGVLGLVAFFFLVVAPVEEAVKWLAIRLSAYRSDEFTAVVDGAVYGAMAGLGFATIENAIYIVQEVLANAWVAEGAVTLSITVVRSLAGPGHVIYSAFAGYYLGLARFNPDHRGPIIVKGLLIAAGAHATYNTGVTMIPWVLERVPGLEGVSVGAAFVGFVIVYDGALLLVLLRKLRRYRHTFQMTGAVDADRDTGTDNRPAEAGPTPPEAVEQDNPGETETNGPAANTPERDGGD